MPAYPKPADITEPWFLCVYCAEYIEDEPHTLDGESLCVDCYVHEMNARKVEAEP